MSRTFKEKPNYLSQILKNEEELNKVYIRERHFKQNRFQHQFDRCLDCSNSNRHHCQECGDQEIEDLVTACEKSY